ncbi:MAG: gliding motility-associated C-terminal domain-containing protein [Chitinophagales bacterium]
MNLKMRFLAFAVLFLSFSKGLQAQLIINELSNGPAGAQEYVELLVTGTAVCGSPNTVDLRGWIIDDNNSWHATGSGTGIASGHTKFDSIPQWANVKIGSIILVYNDAEMSPATTALTADPSDANGDCVYIVPISSSVLLKNTTLPASGGTMTTYAVAGTPYSTTGTWNQLGMANGGDAFHTVSPANYSQAYHAIGWGNNTTALNVYFSASQGGSVINMTNAIDNDPFNQANYTNTSASTDETPGAPNNAANAAWIQSMNNNCQTFTPPTTTRNLSICSGQSIVIGGVTVTTPGNYIDTIPATVGCDTIRTNVVSFAPMVVDTQFISICAGTPLVINGQNITSTGIYKDTIPSAVSCDTSRTYAVLVNPYNSKAVNVQLCPGQSTVINGQTITTAGTYRDTVSAPIGCDTIITYTVTTSNFINRSQSIALCPGDAVVINGVSVTTAGTYLDTIPSAVTCDTLVTYQVSVGSFVTRTTNLSFCQGQSITVNGVTYTASTTFNDTIPATVGCDTIVTYNIVQNPVKQTTKNITICQGQSYFAGGANQTTNGVYTDVLSTTLGCDSTVTTNLTVLPKDTTIQSVSICTGYTYGGVTITADTAFYLNLTNQNGCDSTVAVNVTALQSPQITVSNDTSINLGSSVVLHATGGGTYVWSNGVHFDEITVNPQETSTYYVTVTDINTCAANDSVVVTVTIPDVFLLIPTAFTPNGDGHNDFFDILNRSQFTINIFHVYNRWGELVHSDATDKWDGTFRGVEQPVGTFVFYVEATSNITNKKYTAKGNVTLLR